jgi:hypothetical protein
MCLHNYEVIRHISLLEYPSECLVVDQFERAASVTPKIGTL